MPAEVACRGARYAHVETFKHDFFAATGLYRGPDGDLAVLKVARGIGLGLLPLRWAGEWLTQHEIRMYRRFAALPGVPALIGAVGGNGILHAFVPGHPLGEDERVSDRFFDELAVLLDEVHAAGVAYVDLNKRQNILVGEDGRPYLIDFQISLASRALARHGRAGSRAPLADALRAPWAAIVRRFQREDRYHLLKHKRRLRPDLLSESERSAVEAISPWIQWHRRLFRPLTQLRRRVLARLNRRETVDVAGSSAK